MGLGPRLVLSPEKSALMEPHKRRARGWIETVRAAENVKGLGTIHFDFIDNLGLNAVAEIRHKTGIIGATAGALLLPWDLFKRLLSHPETFLGIGDPGRESIGPCHADPLAKNFSDLAVIRGNDNRSMHSPRPNDPIRKSFAEIAVRVAFDFLVTHEIAHICHGHVGYLYASCGLPYMLELNRHFLPPTHDPMTRQAIEMDADSEGVGSSIGIVLQAKNPMFFGEENQSYLSNPEQALYLWTVAVVGLIYLWGFDLDLDSLMKAHHPPNGTRLLMCLATAQENIRKRVPEIFDKFDAITQAAVSDLFDGIRKIGAGMPLSDGVAFFMAINDQRCHDHISKILAQWKVIRPELVKFSYHQRLAP